MKGHYCLSICADCANTSRGCEWATKFKPVKGWKVESVKRKVRYFKGITDGYLDTYRVLECPNFKKRF